MQLPKTQTEHIQLSGENFSCFLTLPLEISYSKFTDALILNTDHATITIDPMRLTANNFGPSAPKGGR